MNDYTREFFEMAVEELSDARKATDDPVKVIACAEQGWVCVRDAQIEEWAEGIQERVSNDRLLYLYRKACALMNEVDPKNDWGSSTRDEWKICECSWALANLRWINQDNAGRQPHLEFEPAEIKTWLAERRTFQPALFEVES